MATLQTVVLLALCVLAQSLLQTIDIPINRNTIFADERFKGEAFEDTADYSNIQPYGIRNTDDPYRLPTNTKPDHYKILWDIDMVSKIFKGEVDIDLYAQQADVNAIVIHAADMTITSVDLKLGTTAVAISPYYLNSQYQTMTIPLAGNAVLQYNAANPVKYTLSIKFESALRTDMSGIYQSWFRNNHQEEVSWMASTQFQSTSSRKAFPCYDEPSFKATFNVTIRRPNTYKSWFNTKLLGTVANNVPGYSDDIYTQTPIMSTYLLALIVAEYSSIPTVTNEYQLFEVIARPGAIEDGQGEYAFDVGNKLLSNMSEHTGIDFYSVSPNLKMTQAAIPDFSAGAMENWGLLTYREAYIMYHPEDTSGYFKQIIAYILSHEITHMWYGNLVTCDWWDVTWLNEGFARFYQYYLTSWVEDEMGFETRFITEQLHAVLLTDSSNNPQPLTNPGVSSPGAVSAMFSTITYNKGACIIRQTEHLLGADVHREGLKNYLLDRSFSTTKPMDLFNALNNASQAFGATAAYGPSFSFIDYYKSWTEQPGHPVLNVQIDHKTGNMIITQRRFNINSGYSPINTNYIIPITFASKSNPDFENTKPTHIIDSTTTIINRGSVGDEWTIFNKQQTGYYRVNYDDYTWDLIILELRGPNRNSIHEYNRAQIVNDVFQFARSGLMTYKRALTILSFLEFETSYAPWVAAMTGFSWIRNRYAGTPFLTQIENLIKSWAANVMKEVTYNHPTANEDFMTSYLRYQLAPIMCAMKDPECLSAARTHYNNFVNNNVPVHADNRNWVFCNILRDGNQNEFNTLWTRFQQHNVYTEKIMLLTVLGCTSHTASLNTFLDAIVDDNYLIRAQDYTSAWNSAVSGNEENTQKVFDYIKSNLAKVTSAFGSASTPLSYVSARLRTETEVNAFQQWAEANQAALGDSYQSVVNGAESARESIQWATANQQDFNEYITVGGTDVTTTTASPPAPPQEPVIEQQPNLVEPEKPDIPDSATCTIISLSLLVSAVVAHFVI